MKGRCVGITLLSISAIVFALIFIGKKCGLRWNASDSAPHGLWLVRSEGSMSIKRGVFVEVCPPNLAIVQIMVEKGYLPTGECEDSGAIPLLKPVSAVAGDTVKLQHGQEVRVNGISLANTSAMVSVSAWPEGEYFVSPEEVWLFSSYNPGSFDSRYFGPVKLVNIRGVTTPVVIFGDDTASSMEADR